MNSPRCYLCGESIEGIVSQDHVPPRQFFAPELRRMHNLDGLKTLPTHVACNNAYSKDEEYTVASLAVGAMDSYTGNAVVQHHAEKFRAGAMQGLGKAVLNSFDRNPTDVVITPNQVVIRHDRTRVERIVWKIVRGLYFAETSIILSENCARFIELRSPAHTTRSDLNELWELVKSQPSRGDKKAVFDYKYLEVPMEEESIHVWALLWWDRIMWLVSHSTHPERN